MNIEKENIILPASSNLAADSDRVEAPVVDAAPRIREGATFQMHTDKLVAAQASMSQLTTGLEDQQDPFMRRGLARTPPRGRAYSLGAISVTEDTVDLLEIDNGKVENSAKRKRVTEEAQQEDQFKALINMLTRKTSELVDHSKKKTTKVEIKRLSEAICNIANKIKMRYSKGLYGIEPRNEEHRTVESTATTQRFNTSDATTQTSKEDQSSEATTANIYNILEAGTGNRDELMKIINDEWPEHCYSSTEVVEDDLANAAKGKDIGLFTDTFLEDGKGALRRWSEQFQDPGEELRRQKVSLGGVAYISSTIKGPTQSGVVGWKERFLFCMMVKETPEDKCEGQDLLDKYIQCALRLKEIAMENQRTVIVIPTPPTRAWHKVRNIFEWAFRNTCKKIMIVKKRRDKRKGQDNEKAPETQKVRFSDAVLVRTQGEGYAAALKKLKMEIDPSTVGVEITGARQTRSGDVLVKVKDNKQATLLKEIIAEKMGPLAASVGRRKVLHIKDMEATTELEEIMKTLTEIPGVGGRDLVVKALRPAAAGTQNATIITNEETANILLSNRRIKIGWAVCRVVAREEYTRCVKCWEEGHQAKSCNGPDRSRVCWRCGENGHRARACQKPRRCVRCNTEGHSWDSGNCPGRSNTDKTSNYNRTSTSAVYPPPLRETSQSLEERPK